LDCCQSGACVLTIAPFRWPLLADHEVLATVDDKKSARDEGSLVGDQEEFCVRHVPWAAGSSHEAAFGPGVPASTSSRLVPSWPTRCCNGVSMRPGRIVLARTPHSRLRMARCLVSALPPAFGVW
jgi:hypothetical protein